MTECLLFAHGTRTRTASHKQASYQETRVPLNREWTSLQCQMARLPGSQLGVGLGPGISLPYSTSLPMSNLEVGLTLSPSGFHPKIEIQVPDYVRTERMFLGKARMVVHAGHSSSEVQEDQWFKVILSYTATLRSA